MPTSDVRIPTGTSVYIDHLQTAMHLNTTGYQGGEGPAILFDDKDFNDWPGEEWKFTSHGNDIYTIKNTQTGHYLAMAAGPGRKYPHVEVQSKPDGGDFHWIVRFSGLYDSFTLHPSTDPKRSIQPRMPPAAQGGQLWTAPHHGYLNELFKVVPGRAN